MFCNVIQYRVHFTVTVTSQASYSSVGILLCSNVQVNSTQNSVWAYVIHLQKKSCEFILIYLFKLNLEFNLVPGVELCGNRVFVCKSILCHCIVNEYE